MYEDQNKVSAKANEISNNAKSELQKRAEAMIDACSPESYTTVLNAMFRAYVKTDEFTGLNADDREEVTAQFLYIYDLIGSLKTN